MVDGRILAFSRVDEMIEQNCGPFFKHSKNQRLWIPTLFAASSAPTYDYSLMINGPNLNDRFIRLCWKCPISKIWIPAFRTMASIWYKQLRDVCYEALNSVSWLLVWSSILSICETNFDRKLVNFFLKERAKNLEQGKSDSFTASFLIDYW